MKASKTADDLTADRLKQLTALPYRATVLSAELERMAGVVRSSGVADAHQTCLRLRRIKLALAAAVAQLDDAVTALVRRVESAR